jgi:hypothetical protein
LMLALQLEYRREEFKKALKTKLGDKYDEFVKKLPRFSSAYQRWYSEAVSVVKQLVPDRLSDLTRLYERPKTRKEITWENYVIEDLLQGLSVTRSYDKAVVVNGAAAIPRFEQQMAILKSAEGRFESSLFDIRQLVQADLFDSELDAARELLKSKFVRAAGAIAGVVLEKHLAQVCRNHGITVSKKHPTIGDFNDLLKSNNVIETPQWRLIQHLADLRNLCDHNKNKEPTPEEIDDLVSGVDKTMKTLF